MGRWRVGLLCALGAMMYVCRDFMAGRELAAVLLSYKLDTWAVSTLLIWTLFLPRRLPAAQTLASPDANQTYARAA